MIVVIECAVFVAVFAAICLAYPLGRGGGRPLAFTRGLQELRRYDPAIEAVLEYRSEGGFRTVRKVHVTRSQRRRDGRLYLTGFCHRRLGPRTFRVDRIICVATMDGEVIDKRRFLIDRLAIPPELCTVAGGSSGSIPTRGHLIDNVSRRH
ncbi:MAG TPA: WYL domain-containing protein [Rhizomicrobium sp.]|jgi:hypothetical protein